MLETVELSEEVSGCWQRREVVAKQRVSRRVECSKDKLLDGITLTAAGQELGHDAK